MSDIFWLCNRTIAELETANEALAARVEQMRVAILQFRNEPLLGRAHGIRKTTGYGAMQKAALDNEESDTVVNSILAERDARTLRMAAEVWRKEKYPCGTTFSADAVARDLETMADELAKASALTSDIEVGK